jgi:diphthamide synthase (EF-2-diphthine--ammonia ligase)
MTGVFERARSEGIDEIAYGDLFLEDIRAYREARHAGTGIGLRFPLWGMDTRALARCMLAGGLRATLTCVDPRQLSASFVGRAFDQALLDDLPLAVDPCGERGEFHTFAHAGPMFASPIHVVPGDIVERDGFAFADLMPA